MSLGAATVLIATGEEPRVAATWEDSSYADVDVAIQAELERHGYPTFLRYGGYLMARLKSGDDLTSLSPIGAVAKLDGRPIFITHGRRTPGSRSSTRPTWPMRSGRMAGPSIRGSWKAPSTSSPSTLETAEYERRLDAFFESALGGAAG